MKLRISHPAIGEMTVPVDEHGLVVGRAGGHADLDMNWDRLVSRRHVRFWVERGTLWYEDQLSRNGTWENGVRRVGRHRLREGVWVLVGESYFSAAEALPPERERERDGSGLETLDVPRPSEPTRSASKPIPVRVDPQLLAEDLQLGMPTIQMATASPQPLSASPPPVLLPKAPLLPDVSASDSFAVSFGENTSAELAALTAPPPSVPTPADAPLRQEEPPTSFGSKTEEFFFPPPPPAPTTLPVVSPKHEVAPKPSPAAASPRAQPRFTADRKVQLKVSGPSELRTLWQESVQRGGLYVNHDRPPPRGTPIEVTLHTPGGALNLQAQVVHVLDPAAAEQLGQVPGVGLQFAPVAPEERDAVFRYCDGMASSPTPARSAGETKAVAANMDQVMATLRQFLSRMEQNDLYGALQVEPKARQQDVLKRIDDLKRSFASAEATATPPQLARLGAATRQLEHISSIMGSVARRLEHDFRNGHVRAEERMVEARQKRGPGIDQLRSIWHSALPENLPAAALLVRRALEAKKRRDLAEAIELGRRALELDPFQEDLKKTVDAWLASTLPNEVET